MIQTVDQRQEQEKRWVLVGASGGRLDTSIRDDSRKKVILGLTLAKANDEDIKMNSTENIELILIRFPLIEVYNLKYLKEFNWHSKLN